MNTAQSLYRLPASLADDLAQLQQRIAQFKAGDIPAARFQAFRVPQGIYEQRENGTYMLRVRLPAGRLLPGQMRAIAAVAKRYGNGELHLTSRQDIQVHRVALDAIHPALTALAEAGLSTQGGGGNTVRNIAACPHAGVCPHEVFDVTPHVVRLTEFLLPDPLSYQLPRKYKIAFSGCGEDCATATVSDLGFISTVCDGVQGFAVYVGGGMGANSRVGELLDPFVPATRVAHVAEAVKRVFDQHGNRKNRHRARLRFLVEAVGLAQFTAWYREALETLDIAAPAAIEPVAPVPAADGEASDSLPGFDAWQAASVTRQRQDGYAVVEIAPPLGLLASEQLLNLADITARYGERQLRATNWQGVLLRGVPVAQLPALHAELSRLGLGGADPALLRRMITCAGASTCRLGICLARGLAEAITARLRHSELLPGSAALRLHISGCPNACGRHPVAHIGLHGAARRVGGRLAPYYVVQLGGRIGAGHTALATGSLALPARNVPAFLQDFIAAFHRSPHFPDFDRFLAAGGREVAERVAAPHQAVPDFDDDKHYYFDWGAQDLFSLAGRGPGECGAGVFDLIEVDLASAAEDLEAGKRFTATALAARALLVTRGAQADSHRQALALFRTHFVEQELIPAELHPLVTEALAAAEAPDPEAAFTGSTAAAAALFDTVKKLYEGMGPSLRVTPPAASCGITPVATPAVEIAADHTVDFRGVACPLNYVKTQMALARLKADQVLAVLLDGDGAKNVPASAANDGHEVAALTQEGAHWRVLIRKKPA